MSSGRFVAGFLFVGKKIVSIIFSLALVVLILLIVLAACSNGAAYTNIVSAL